VRRLQCKDPRVVEKYNNVLHDMLEKQNIPFQLQMVNEVIHKPSDLHRQYCDELNSINQAVTDAKHAAESQCRKLKCGRVQWCPSITAVINKIIFWKSMLKQEKGGKVGLSILQQRSKKAGLTMVPHPRELPIPYLEEQISKAHKQFRRLKKDDTQRDTWMAQLIAVQSVVWSRSKKALWKQLCSTEWIRKTANLVCRILKPTGAHHLLSMVIAPDEQTGVRTERSQKTELEQACLEEAG